MKLKEFINAIREKRDEHSVIAQELATIRNNVKSKDTRYNARDALKCIYLSMYGYTDVDFILLTLVSLVADKRYLNKRVGYFGLMNLLRDHPDLLMMITNSLNKDVESPNQYISVMALSCMSEYMNQDIIDTSMSLILQCLGGLNPYVQSKAVVAALAMLKVDGKTANQVAEVILTSSASLNIAQLPLIGQTCIELANRGQTDMLKRLYDNSMTTVVNSISHFGNRIKNFSADKFNKPSRELYMADLFAFEASLQTCIDLFTEHPFCAKFSEELIRKICNEIPSYIDSLSTLAEPTIREICVPEVGIINFLIRLYVLLRGEVPQNFIEYTKNLLSSPQTNCHVKYELITFISSILKANEFIKGSKVFESLSTILVSQLTEAFQEATLDPIRVEKSLQLLLMISDGK